MHPKSLHEASVFFSAFHFYFSTTQFGDVHPIHVTEARGLLAPGPALRGSMQDAGYELPNNLFQTFLNKGGKKGQSLETPVCGTSARC